MAIDHLDPTKEDLTVSDHREVISPTSSNTSDEGNMREKMEHLELGYGKERDAQVAHQIETEAENPNVHQNASRVPSLLQTSLGNLG